MARILPNINNAPTVDQKGLHKKDVFSPPVLAACPAARCAIEACPQPGRPRSGCAAGPFAPRVSHGARTSAGTALGAYRTRLHRGSGSPLRGLPPHVRVQPRTACAQGLMQGKLAPCQPRVAPVQRHAPCARPSGLLPHAGCPHATGQPSRAGGVPTRETTGPHAQRLRESHACPSSAQARIGSADGPQAPPRSRLRPRTRPGRLGSSRTCQGRR